MTKAIEINPRSILKANLALILALVILHLLFGSAVYEWKGWRGEWGRFFSLDYEENIPTLYSALSLLLSSILAISISRLRELTQRKKVMWGCLGIIFLALAFDEWQMIHERLEFFGVASWVFLYLPAAALIALIYGAFILKLPKQTRNLIILSFTLFIAGSVGVEMTVFHALKIEPDPKNPVYFALTTLEESLEMIGIAIFNYALIRHILHYRTILISPLSAEALKN